MPKEANLCKAYMNGPQPAESCAYEKCKYMHDVSAYLSAKGADIADTCYIYSTRGFCTRGVTCRFAGAHLDGDLKNLTNAALFVDGSREADTLNSITTSKVVFSRDLRKSPSNPFDLSFHAGLQTILRKRTYVFDDAKAAIKLADQLKTNKNRNDQPTTADQSDDTNKKPTTDVVAVEKLSGAIDDSDQITLRTAERKSLNLRDKLLLSPLTTVGNLPFRRICKEFGADVTCGEMACAVPLVNGISQEWALAKRHASEDIFGVQLCANSPQLLAYAAQLVRDNCEVDFVDLNMGCPIELIYSQGAGSALIRRHNILEVMVRSCAHLLGDIPFTVKTRTGIYATKSVAHELVPKLEQWGAAAVTLHGRSREQRYTRTANWEYIEQCAAAARSMPVFGNGDVLSYEDYVRAREVAPSVASVMIGRGALIKPWLFKEIKEQRNWDPSSAERLEMLRGFANYGLEHWGSDTQGVENTRRFLLEWQSFLYRYVPYGILEQPPQRINQRPDTYVGRDDLETLMASPKASDWVKLSEMLLGPVPDGYVFVPKHKANSY